MKSRKAIESTGLKHESFLLNATFMLTNNESSNQNLSRSRGRIQTYRTFRTAPILDPQQQQQQHQNQRRMRVQILYQFQFLFPLKIHLSYPNHDVQIELNELKANIGLCMNTERRTQKLPTLKYHSKKLLKMYSSQTQTMNHQS